MAGMKTTAPGWPMLAQMASSLGSGVLGSAAARSIGIARETHVGVRAGLTSIARWCGQQRAATGGGGPGAPQPNPADREFLPAALEIVETPPTPARIATLWFICLAFAATLAWSCFSVVDIHAVAQGKLQPRGRSKVVQPFDPGTVVAVHVENGSRVVAGDVVAELDATESIAEQEGIRRDLAASEEEGARRTLAIAMAGAGSAADRQGLAAGDTPGTGLGERERRVLRADINQLQATLEALHGQLGERRATMQRLNMSMAARGQLIATLKERVDTRQKLDDKNQGFRARVVDALQELGREKTNLAGEQGQLIEAEAGMRSLERKLEQVRTEFVADQAQRLAEAERKRDRLTQDLIKARSKAQRTRLTAPIDGSVQQLAITTLGQVVSAGQALMTVVPVDSGLEIEANIPNQDIGFVAAGQTAVIKVDAFPFTRYGTIEGTVTKVSREAVDERDASGLADSTATTRPQGAQGAAASPRGPTLVYPATVRLSRQSVAIDNRDVPLSAGMLVSVEIRTGQRRVIDFLLAPLREVASHSMHER